MKEFLKKPEQIARIEFWAATTIFVFAVFFQISAAVQGAGDELWSPNLHMFNEARVPFSYYQHYLIPMLFRYGILYVAFLLLNFLIVPKLTERKAPVLNSLLVLMIFTAIGLSLGATDMYLKRYEVFHMSSQGAAYRFLLRDSMLYAFWLLLVFGFYTLLKYAGTYIVFQSEAIQKRFPILTSGSLIVAVLWIISIFLLLVGRADHEFVVLWALVWPSAILLYGYSMQTLIPKSLGRKHPFRAYLGKVFWILLVTIVPISLFAFLLLASEDTGGVMGMFNAFCQLLITAPFTWMVFKRRMKGNEEVYTLKKELGQSHAHFDFLRSQINPHFLFNALNTIYGTAIQEGAERTGEGIERLGDMMRFMLQENMQDQIALVREIEYLNNYISLQRLRTDPNPNVQIRADIAEEVHAVRIAPMLLIPFVENAFKHGISLREPSYIRITLEVKEDTLHFDVHNSKHERSESDPERGKSGIGLNNVRQRLLLLYPGRHELIIRETGKEFFVHLTIRL